MVFVDYFGHFVSGLLLVVFAAVMVAAYLSHEARKAKFWRPLLWLFQYSAIVILLLILWNPSRPQMGESSARNSVLVLFDTSESMSVVEDESGTRLDKALSVFEERFQPHDPDGPVYRVYGFDRQSYYSDSADSLRRWGRQTNMHSALGALSKYELTMGGDALESEGSEDNKGQKVFNGGKVVGAVIFTDGQADDKNVNSYLPVSDKNIKVSIIGVGSKTPQSDISVKSIKAPSRVAVGMVYNVDVEVSGKNLGAERVLLELLRGDYIIASRSVPGEKLSSGLTEKFEVGAVRLGKESISARVSSAVKEVNAANNERSTMVEVIENARLKVLFYSQVVNFNIGKVRQALARDKKIELDIGLDAIKKSDLSKKASQMCGHVGLPEGEEGFYKYDVIILGPCAADRLSASQIDGLYSFVVERGGGLILLPGKSEYGPSGWKNEKIRALIPVAFEAGRETERSMRTGRIELTAEGFDSKIVNKTELRNYEDAVSAYYADAEKKPAASTLASVGGEPIVAVHRVGRGRVCLVNASKLFRWYREDLKGGMLQKFVSGLTSYVGSVTNAEAGVELFAERISGQSNSLRFDAYVRDNQFAGISGATVLLSIGKDFYQMNPAGDGYYAVEVEDIVDESVVATVQAEIEGAFLGEKTIAVNLPALRNEMTNIELDSNFLVGLTKRLGGRYFYIDDFDKDISKGYEGRTYVSSLSSMISVWPRWTLLLILCGILSINWFIRRAIGLV